ncbi:proline-rich protein HaeIII subfamily 1-like [Cydia pomonella]|uniref:proline-rich protein HaeIII subfamily 1-like n=1 Tax=Cydia pomonella TaxID=82600 RepID=UPI002ADE1472|nr:proline-rich protein HaeIII subfamily 1-like [Cydia pomonella]
MHDSSLASGRPPRRPGGRLSQASAARAGRASPAAGGPDIRQRPSPAGGPDIRQRPSPAGGPDIRQRPSPAGGPDIRQRPSPAGAERGPHEDVGIDSHPPPFIH